MWPFTKKPKQTIIAQPGKGGDAYVSGEGYAQGGNGGDGLSVDSKGTITVIPGEKGKAVNKTKNVPSTRYVGNTRNDDIYDSAPSSVTPDIIIPVMSYDLGSYAATYDSSPQDSGGSYDSGSSDFSGGGGDFGGGGSSSDF